MKSYIAQAQVGNMVTDVTFDARSDHHAIRIAERHNWDLLGELMFTQACGDELIAMIKSHGVTLH